jgi:ComF family protein
MLSAFHSLFFPSLCMACDAALQQAEDCICTHCRVHLPQTNYHMDADNPLIKYFWGKIPIEAIGAYYFFNKGGKVQTLLHRLKYKGNKEIGLKVGRFYGYDLKKSSLFQDLNFIVPIPLHPKKENKRGYNQSLYFALGLAETIGIEVAPTALARVSDAGTQTRKSRFSRSTNVNEQFQLNSHPNFENQHLLLVDDVITTGATLEACAHALLQIKGVKISIAAMACAW